MVEARTHLPQILGPRWPFNATDSPAALEWRLAVARLPFALLLLAGEMASTPAAAWHAPNTATMLAAVYSLFAAGVLQALATRDPVGPTFGVLVQAADLGAAAAMVVASNGQLAHFLPLFVLVGAAFRYGKTHSIVSGLVLAGAILLEAHPAFLASEVTSARQHLLTLGAYTVIVSVLVGHLAQREAGARTESQATGRLFESIRIDAGPVASLRAVLRALQSMFGARQALVAVRDTQADVWFLWRSRAATGPSGPAFEPIERGWRRRYWFPIPVEVDACLLGSGSDRPRPVGVDVRGHRVSYLGECPTAFLEAHPARQVFVLPQLSVGRFQARLFLLDPSVSGPVSQLHLLQSAARRVTPVVHNLFLDRQLRVRLQENERARVARELHDGVIQALIGLEMRLDVARRRIHTAPDAAVEDVTEVQRHLRGQVVDVRTLMQQLRPPELDCRRLVEFLSETTERFRSSTGIQARFLPGLEQMTLPSRVCREMARIVDEALVNVRKHSGARSVAVRLRADEDAWTLSIEDDGQGFNFAGRMSQGDLDARGLGPVVIKERAQALGGSVAIESRPGQGARIDVMVPKSNASGVSWTH